MMMMSYGLVTPASGFLIPQLEDSEIGFGINKDQGSWLGIYVYIRDTFFSTMMELISLLM